jgi:hypothetical protein
MDAKAIDNIPAIILTEAEHIEMTNNLNAARNEVMGGANQIPSPQQLWKIYQKAYAARPAWLEAIKGYFPNVR